MRTENLSYLKTENLSSVPSPNVENLETMVGVHLLSDLNAQLEDISRDMESDLKIKQSLRSDLLELQGLPAQVETVELEGELYRDLNETQLAKLDYPESAVPFGNSETGETLYRLSEEQFAQAQKLSIEQRKETLAQMNSQGELTMIKIQALVEQRKQALTLLSNLLAASHQVAQTIIGNIRP